MTQGSEVLPDKEHVDICTQCCLGILTPTECENYVRWVIGECRIYNSNSEGIKDVHDAFIGWITGGMG